MKSAKKFAQKGEIVAERQQSGGICPRRRDFLSVPRYAIVARKLNNSPSYDVDQPTPTTCFRGDGPMANVNLKTLTILALAAGSLSVCAVINGAANGAWSGTESAAKFISYPVRALLRDAPEDEVQFAKADVAVAVDADAAKTTVSDDKIDMMSETILDVEASRVLGATTAPMPVSTTTVTTTKTAMTAPLTDTSASMSVRSSSSSSSTSIEIIETVAINDFQSIDVLTVGPVSYVRTAGVGSLEDWRTCDIEAGGFWKFDAAQSDGTLNPKFAQCMRTKDYIQETELEADVLTKMGTPVLPAALKPLP